MDEKRLRRAGLDYLEFASVREYPDLVTCLQQFDRNRVFALTTHGSRPHSEPRYQADDVLLFGPETRGLPQPVRDGFSDTRRIRIPMVSTSRSMNLSNAVAVVLYEALRQLQWSGLH